MKAPENRYEHVHLLGTRVSTPDGPGVIRENDEEHGNFECATVELDDYDYEEEFLHGFEWETLKFEREDKKVPVPIKEGSKMKEKLRAVKDQTVDSSKEGAWLTLGKQAAKRSLAIVLKAVPAFPSPYVKAAKTFLASDTGLAVYAVAAGTVLSFVPQMASSEDRHKLCTSMQTWGFHVLTDGVLDPILDELSDEFDGMLTKAKTKLGA